MRLFQHDHRNGVKPWKFDQTKWIIWTLSRVGLTAKLRRVPAEMIRLAEKCGDLADDATPPDAVTSTFMRFQRNRGSL